MSKDQLSRIAVTVSAVIGATVLTAAPLTFALLGGLLSSSDCGLGLFGACTPSTESWWVTAKFFLAAVILATVPVAAGYAAWQRSSSWGYGSVGILVLGIITIYAPTQ